MFTLTTDLLYWQPSEDGVPVALTEYVVKQPKMKWGLGWRIGFEYQFPRDHWIGNLNWTSIPIQNQTETSGHLFPSWSNAPQTSTDFVSHAKTRWRLHLGIVDLEVKKPWELSSCFTLSPRLGIRFASIRQKFYVAYSGGSLFPHDTDNFNTKNKYWGIGPEVGVNASWNLGYGFSLISQIGYALVYGEFYIHETERQVKTGTPYLKFFDTFYQVCSLADLTLGLSWTYSRISLHISWEQHFYSAQNQLVNFNSSSKLFGNQGALAINGLIFGGTWGF